MEATLGQTVCYQSESGALYAAVVTRVHAGGRACLCVFHPSRGPEVVQKAPHGTHRGEWHLLSEPLDRDLYPEDPAPRPTEASPAAEVDAASSAEPDEPVEPAVASAADPTEPVEEEAPVEKPGP